MLRPGGVTFVQVDPAFVDSSMPCPPPAARQGVLVLSPDPQRVRAERDDLIDALTAKDGESGEA